MQYTIEEGKHSAKGFHFGLHTGETEQTFRVTFDKNCNYPAIDSEDDTNKLFGWSYGIFPFRKQVTFTGARNIGDTEIFEWEPAHHNNSVRVGWKPNRQGDYVSLCIYAYLNGERIISDSIINIPYDEPTTLKLKNNYTTGAISLTLMKYVRTTINLFACIKPKFGYMLYPYFGGNAPAPHKITLTLKS